MDEPMRRCGSMSTHRALSRSGSRHTRSSSSRTFADGRNRGLAWRYPWNVLRCSAFRPMESWPSLLGLRHSQVYGAILCVSPGGGYKPPGVMPSPLPRTYLVAGTQEPFFLGNARRWADALRDAGADIVMNERVGSHGGAFWRKELPLMVAWAFG